MDENTTVETMLNETSAQDDAVTEAQTADSAETLSDFLSEGTSEATTETQDKPEAAPAKEPGWMQKRIDGAIRKATPEIEARISARYENEIAQLRSQYQTLQNANLAREADALVASGEFKNKNTALEYLQLKAGVPVTAEADTQSEPSAAKAENGEARARAERLFNQAKDIERATGVNVMDLFNNDAGIKQKIVSGEWDFADVYQNTQKQKQPEQMRYEAPRAVRSGGAMGLGNADIRKMSAEQFRKMNEMLEKGGKIDMRK